MKSSIVPSARAVVLLALLAPLAVAIGASAPGAWVVAATTTVTPAFALAAGAPDSTVLWTASFKRARQLSFAADAFSVAATFADATLKHGYVVSADAASFTATFQDATLTYTPGSGYTLKQDDVTLDEDSYYTDDECDPL